MEKFDIFSPFGTRNTSHNISTFSSGSAAKRNPRRNHIFNRELKPDELDIASQGENFETCSYF